MAESIRARVRVHLNRALHRLGLHLVRREQAFEMDDLLAAARNRGQRFGTIIDVGASDGVWSLRAQRRFPESCFVLFEPLAERRAALARLARNRGFHVVTAAAGAAAGTIAFAVDPGLDGSGVAAPNANNIRNVPVETIDEVIAQRGLKGPFLLKLDTHGFEIPILLGAAAVLRATDLLVIEAYNFNLTPDSLRFGELCAWLEGRGFRCCDMADPMRRPTDGVLWQMDLAFAPVTSACFRSNVYQ